VTQPVTKEVKHLPTGVRLAPVTLLIVLRSADVPSRQIYFNTWLVFSTVSDNSIRGPTSLPATTPCTSN